MYKNELRAEYLGVTAINPFASQASSSRLVMFASHISQRLVIEAPDEKRITTGVEQEFAKYTFSIKMPENGRILKIIDRYPEGISVDSLQYNPETVVIYEVEETKEIDFFSIVRHTTLHQYFGFSYKFTDAINELRPGAYIKKGTIFADSPAVAENNGYMFGLNVNVAFMSVPGVTEDGMVISSDILHKLKFKVYETRVVNVGSNSFPLNLYGSVDKYKPFMNIGEYLNDDGLLMTLRAYNEDLYPVDTSIYDVMEPDYLFDKGMYVRNGRGRIVDIKVVTNNNKNRRMPVEISEFIYKYEKALRTFHQNLLDAEGEIRRERHRKYRDDHVNISPRLHRLLVESLVVTDYTNAATKQTLNLSHRKDPLDEYRIEFVIEYEITPQIGFKLSDSQGGKGVICKIEKPENMPVDAAGNRADIITDGGSGIARTIPSRHYEHYFAGAARDTTTAIRRMLGVDGPTASGKLIHPINRVVIETLDLSVLDNAYQYLLGFYDILTDKQFRFFNSILLEERIDHLTDVVNKGIYLFMPIGNPRHLPTAVKCLEEKYPQTYGPVQYVGNSGNKVLTKKNIRIAPLYMMLLDKIADDGLSVASAKLHPSGVLAKFEKNVYPWRMSPTRTIGETEGRIFAGYLGPEALAEMMDLSNNPATMRHLYTRLLSERYPSNIPKIVDRSLIPLGKAKPIELIQHMNNCNGFTMTYEPEELL